VARTYRYDSFGRIISQTGTLDQPFTFTGREYDPETGLYYYRARYYDPKAGRFISKDPIGFGGGDLNLFRYVGNDPANFTDPSGLFAIPWPIIVPPIEKIVAPIIGGIIGGIIGNEILKECEKDKPCPPCNPPVGTIGYRYDAVPPSKPHKPYPTDHVHLYKMNQNPNNCQCFWQPIGVTAPPPPVGAVPLP